MVLPRIPFSVSTGFAREWGWGLGVGVFCSLSRKQKEVLEGLNSGRSNLLAAQTYGAGQLAWRVGTFWVSPSTLDLGVFLTREWEVGGKLLQDVTEQAGLRM